MDLAKLGPAYLNGYSVCADVLDFEDLPYDVKLKILMCLDILSQKKVERVCKEWKEILATATVLSEAILDFDVLPSQQLGVGKYRPLCTSRFALCTRKLTIHGSDWKDDFDSDTDLESDDMEGWSLCSELSIQAWRTLFRYGTGSQILIFENVLVDMGCLLRLPKAVHKIVLRNVILMSPCLLYTKRRSWEDWDVSVDRFTIHLPGGTDRSWVLTEKLYEVVNTFAEPLSPDEMEDLRRYNTLDAPDDTLDYWDRLADIITGWEQRMVTVESAKDIPPLTDLKPATLRSLQEYYEWTQDLESSDTGTD